MSLSLSIFSQWFRENTGADLVLNGFWLRLQILHLLSVLLNGVSSCVYVYVFGVCVGAYV